jgi:hypothetical protein
MISNEYAAGFFDADGCVTIHWSKPHNRFATQVQVINTKRNIVEEFHMQFGGHIYQKTSKQANDLTCWVWEAGADNARAFLTAVYPNLVVKKTRAWIALHIPVGQRGQRVHYLTKIAQAVAYTAMRLYNARGRRPDLSIIEPALNAHAALGSA